MTNTPKSLTPAQERFAEEYLLDLNATRAYRVAYAVKTKSARTAGARLLANVDIAARVQALMDARSQRVEIDQDYVLRQLKENVERAMQQVAVLDPQGKPTGEYRYEGSVANGALKLLGEHLGMFKKVHEVRIPDGAFMVPGPVTDQQWAALVAEQAAELQKRGVKTH